LYEAKFCQFNKFRASQIVPCRSTWKFNSF
jgi:hypothetical protein